MAHTRDVVWCCLDDRRWKQCGTKIDSRYCYDFGHYSVWVPYVLVLILHVSLRTKITVTLFTIISTYSPWRQKNREARSTALQPIRLITKRVVLGRACIITPPQSLYSRLLRIFSYIITPPQSLYSRLLRIFSYIITPPQFL